MKNDWISRNILSFIRLGFVWILHISSNRLVSILYFERMILWIIEKFKEKNI